MVFLNSKGFRFFIKRGPINNTNEIYAAKMPKIGNGDFIRNHLSTAGSEMIVRLSKTSNILKSNIPAPTLASSNFSTILSKKYVIFVDKSSLF